MPRRWTRLRTLLGAAVLPLALVSPAWGDTDPAPPAPEPPSTLCAPAGTLHGEHGAHAMISLCAGSGTPTMAVSAPATCRQLRATVHYACRTSGTWTARRAGETVASGTLPGSGQYPGPGTYDFTATVRVRSMPEGVDVEGTVRATLTLTAPRPKATHGIEVDRSTLRPDSVTTLTYTVQRHSDEGDGSARFGLIAEEGTGAELTTTDTRCVNPLIGRYPAQDRLPHALDCALTDLQPGHPDTVVVRVTLKSRCSTVVSKLGYWMPQGQTLYTGGMLAGPTVTCS
ncbi:hypothetical protein OH768_48800 [Streptomyces sp. NBC_01622]|uniref:hypothetical protein n=1 Tax=Streptomyces sp. NBC_01622 TaxID=2975903 RepID=UPI0038657A55|nr:hypothetical protein OH768_48800 [Streptomyces sp. NBC_01622]